MHPAPLRPALAHIIVCVNRRPAGDALGPGCGSHGDALHTRLQHELGKRGLRSKIWLARSYCLGVCPKRGACVTIVPRGDLLTEVEEEDAGAVVDRALGRAE